MEGEVMTDPYRKWLAENEDEVPSLVAEEAESLGADLSDPTMRSLIRGLLEDDPDIFGDWDAYE